MSSKYLLFLIGYLLLSVVAITITNHNSGQPSNEGKQRETAYQTTPALSISKPHAKESSESRKMIDDSQMQKEGQSENSRESSPSQSASTDSDGVTTLDGKINNHPKVAQLSGKSMKKSGVRVKEKKQVLPVQKVGGEQDANNFSILSIIFIYISSFIAVLFMIKHYRLPDQSTLEVILDLVVLVQRYFQLKRNGYKAPDLSEEIDDIDSVTIGYSGEHGKRLFWEKNSVEGI